MNGLVASAAAAAATVTTATATSVTTAAATTIAAAATAAIATTAAAAAFAGLAFLSLADTEAAAAHVLSVEAVDGSFTEFTGGKSHKGKSSGTAGLAVHGNVKVYNGTEIAEERTNFVLVGCEGQIAHVEFHLNILELRADKLECRKALAWATLEVAW